MLCELCKKNRATIHKLSPMHGRSIAVCSGCLTKPQTVSFTVTSTNYGIGIGPTITSIEKTITSFSPSISSLHQQSIEKNIVCTNCAYELSAFKKTSKLGCSVCYTTFKTQLAPIIKQIHGI
ncbi:MAG: hypothetical protein FWE16_04715 [Firmicutes bacterium]|nr:hypothetical protein [Bacillota bacterium]